VIVGETGSGKSTQIPQYLVEGGWTGNDFQIVCTQPRRLAAITLCQRVAQEMGDSAKVGYTVRFDDQSGLQTQIKYVTDGILLQEAASATGDPLLSQYSVVMIDEAHERTLQSDAVMGLLPKIRKHRPELRIIVCSATIDAQQFLDFFTNSTTENATTGTIISVDGRQHPVDILYLQSPAPDYVTASVETAWKIVQQYEDGDILCFLPTGENIDQAVRLAEEFFDNQQQQRDPIDLLPLYGSLPYHMQTRIFQNSKKGTRARRVIFSTNIAETSVTVPHIRFVIDSGLVKLPYFDSSTGLERLIVAPISQKSAQQRAGRAGRNQSGICLRLYTEQYLTEKMEADTPPEILRSNITSFILTLKALGVDNILAFDLMDIPNVSSLQHGLECLYALGAIDDNTYITKDGLDMASFPVEPRVARMLLESVAAGCSWEVLAVAGALQVRELFHMPRRGYQSQRRQQQMLDYESAMSEIADLSGDHVTYANLFAQMDDLDMSEEDCKERFINYLALRRGLEVRSQLARFLRRFGRVQALGLASDVSARSKAIRKCVTAGFFFNIAKLDNDGHYYTLRNHILVSPSPSSILMTHAKLTSEYIVFGESYDGSYGDIELRSVSVIEAKWLRELAPHYWQ
jgi:ATP-dependent RNA helicase DDX35